MWLPFLEETLSSGTDDNTYHESEYPDVLRIEPNSSV